jgi:hypothetical protein
MRRAARAPILLCVVGAGAAGCLLTIDRARLETHETEPPGDDADVHRDGEEPSPPLDATFDAVGSSSANPGRSCLDVLMRAGGGSSDGVYWIRPAGSPAPFEVRCDMSSDEGGWTLVENYPLGEQDIPLRWSTIDAEGTAFHDLAVPFKLADATINALRTTGFRVNARASRCQSGPCTIMHSLFFKPTCAFSGVATSTACATAYLDRGFSQPTPAAAAPAPCAWHGGLVDSVCTQKGGIVTNHDPIHEDAGIFLCVGELNSGTIACVREGTSLAGVQVWVR